MRDYTQHSLPFPPKFIEIPLSKTGKHANKYVAIADAIDADLSHLNWRVCPSGKTHYACRAVTCGVQKQKSVWLHRVIMERVLGRQLTKDEDVDHIDMDGLNCRRENLRVASRVQNKRNGRVYSNNTSGFKGVSYKKSHKKWAARITIDGKDKWLGYFNTPEDAHAAYCKKADEIFGEFANYGTG